MSVNARKGEYEHIELFGKPALFTSARIQTDSVPDGWYCYDLRGSDDDPGEPVTIEPYVVINHAGTVLTHEKINIPGEGFLRLGNSLGFLDEHLTFQAFCEEHDIPYPADNQTFKLRPASESEAGTFYAMTPEKDAELGCIGHVRMDFGHGGKEFWHTWGSRGDEALNSPEFKRELGEVVDELRKTVLKDLRSMSRFCYDHGGELGQDARQYGYAVETENYRYCLRCNPQPGDYQGYLTCFDKRRQKLNLARKKGVIGRVSFASGEAIAYTNAEEYIKAVKEELPYHATSGFRYETITDDPTVRKAVDDILYDLYGEQNPRREENYGLTVTGKAALKKAADPTLPHTYSWFVMTGVNTPSEHLTGDLTLPEAILRYRELDSGNKRIGVTKDGIATVDFVVTLAGEEQYFHDHEKLASFKHDPVITEAVNTMHQELDAPQQGMTMKGMM